MSTIGIGIPVFNDYVLTGHLLDSIFLYTERSDINKIIVIDDGSNEEYRDSLRKVCKCRDVDIIINDTNLGVPKSWNKLVKELNTDYLILLNNDTVVWNGWLKAIKYALENNSDVGTVSLPTILVARCDVHKIIHDDANKRHVEILNPLNKTKRDNTFNLPEGRDPTRIMSPIGCSFAFSRKMFDKAIGFNEIYKYFYEEVDFGISLYGMKHPSVILPCPHIYHIWGATFESNMQIDAQGIMSESRSKFISKFGMDQVELYRRLDHKFDTKVKYLDYEGNKKEVLLNYTYSPESGIEW